MKMLPNNHYVFYSKGQGEGFILGAREDVADYTRPEACVVGGSTLVPGAPTDLGGLWARSLLYIGLLAGHPAGLVFFIGEEEEKQYYCLIHLIAEDRLFIMHAHQSGRDYRWINGRWK